MFSCILPSILRERSIIVSHHLTWKGLTLSFNLELMVISLLLLLMYNKLFESTMVNGLRDDSIDPFHMLLLQHMLHFFFLFITLVRYYSNLQRVGLATGRDIEECCCKV